jgi:hypothetical protein
MRHSSAELQDDYDAETACIARLSDIANGKSDFRTLSLKIVMYASAESPLQKLEQSQVGRR